MNEPNKLICTECNWHGSLAERLIAPNPFAADEVVEGCPKCKAVDHLLPVCDEPGCWRGVSCGIPTKSGYRHTCGRHMPSEAERAT